MNVFLTVSEYGPRALISTTRARAIGVHKVGLDFDSDTAEETRDLPADTPTSLEYPTHVE
jgi:hypothetical protein